MDMRKALGMEDGGAEENTASFEVYPEQLGLDAAALAGLQAQLLQHLLPFLRGYIWQRDRFSLQPSTEGLAPWQRKASAAASRRRRAAGSGGGAAPDAALPPHLWGSVNFGDNIEDEWFIVWLLLELTRAFPVTARVWDNDGEFLLIEAAYGLPRWLKPETAQNRVWLHAGAFHLMPLPRFAGDPLLPATPSLTQALLAVRGTQIATKVPPKMEAALLPRVSGFPERAAELMHVTRALLPARVAHLLAWEPQLVAAAVEAFHYRDPDDVRAASKLSAFPPCDMVLAAPTLSRCLYAQLALQEYAPPRGYPMPMPTDPQYKAAEVGLKLTAGFEMMFANRARFGQLQEAQPGAEGQPTPAGEAALAGDAGWAAFQARLLESGYFRDALPGSQQHGQLLAAALDSYRATQTYRSGSAALAAPALLVQAALRRPADPAALPAPEQLPPEGDEGWLAEQAGQQLEAELQQRQAELERAAQHKQQRRRGPAQQQQQQRGGEEEFDPSELAGRLRAFVDGMAGLEGAEVPRATAAGAAGGGGGGVQLDESAFAAELQQVLGLTQAAMRHAGVAAGEGGSDDDSGGTSSDEGSSFFSGDASSQSDDDASDAERERRQQRAQQPRPETATGPGGGGAAAGQEGWEADTATDSDDGFMQAYGQALEQQLAGTRMAESFERAPAQPAEGQQGEASAALRPVDLDVNLVESLLASHGEQAGLAGPASSLAGLLGVALPPPQPRR